MYGKCAQIKLNFQNCPYHFVQTYNCRELSYLCHGVGSSCVPYASVKGKREGTNLNCRLLREPCEVCKATTLLECCHGGFTTSPFCMTYINGMYRDDMALVS